MQYIYIYICLVEINQKCLITEVNPKIQLSSGEHRVQSTEPLNQVNWVTTCKVGWMMFQKRKYQV